MRNTVIVAVFAALVLTGGCANQINMLEDPFGRSTHEIFTREGTGETGLYIQDETWCVLIDLKGYRESHMQLESSREFLVRKNSRGIFASVFATRIEGATNGETCQKSIYKRLFHRKESDLVRKTVGGREVMVNTYLNRKQIDYCPYYKGYCFDFQFSMDVKTSDDAVAGVIESITFVDDLSLQGKVQKIFRIHDSKLQFGMPATWKYRFKAGFPYDPAIVFSPVEGEAFALHLSPLSGFGQMPPLSRARVGELFAKKLAAWRDRSMEDPVPAEVRDDREDLRIVYFDVRDKRFHPQDKGEYPYQRLGYAMKGKTVFSFTMLFTDQGRADADKALDALAHMKVLDIDVEPVIGIAKPGK